MRDSVRFEDETKREKKKKVNEWPVLVPTSSPHRILYSVFKVMFVLERVKKNPPQVWASSFLSHFCCSSFFERAIQISFSGGGGSSSRSDKVFKPCSAAAVVWFLIVIRPSIQSILYT